jgi:hypothetical protein
MYVAVGALTVVTYARVPARETYAFADTSSTGPLSRLVTYVNFPVAIAAVALAAIAAAALDTRRARFAAGAAALLCVVAAGPGVVDAGDLRARWINAPAVAGTLVVLAILALAIARRGATPGRGSVAGDRARVALAALLLVWAIPWLFAAAGGYVSDAPLLGSVFRAQQPTPGHGTLASVHLGLHEGLFGTQLALTALVLSRALGAFAGRARTALALFLGVMLAYGVAVAANDGWNEQLVKRGWSTTHLPYVLTPRLTAGCLAVLLAGGFTAWMWLGRPRPERSHSRVATPRTG